MRTIAYQPTLDGSASELGADEVSEESAAARAALLSLSWLSLISSDAVPATEPKPRIEDAHLLPTAKGEKAWKALGLNFIDGETVCGISLEPLSITNAEQTPVALLDEKKNFLGFYDFPNIVAWSAASEGAVKDPRRQFTLDLPTLIKQSVRLLAVDAPVADVAFETPSRPASLPDQGPS